MRKLLMLVVGTGVVVGASEALSRSELPQAGGADSVELRRLRDEDQADRAAKSIDWAVVGPRDRVRLARVKELYLAGGMQTATDYYNGALILQHGEKPEDFLLAHEFCVAAMMLGKNDRASASLAAAAEDRFLMNIGRPQRFGTQFRSEGAGPMRLYSVGDGVTDHLRRVMAVPSLAEAKGTEAELNSAFEGEQNGVGGPAAVVVPYTDAKFAPLDPARPDGARIAVLRGDPTTGPSTMLMRMAKGAGVLHYHTADYELVVVEGQMRHWLEGQIEEQIPSLGPGSYWYQPKMQPHADSCLSDSCVMFITWSGKRDAVRAAGGR